MSSIQVNHLTFSYDGASDLVFDDVSFSIDSSWRLGLVGRNGKGKTTFLRLLSGELESHGAITGAPATSYFPFAVARPDEPAAELFARISPDVEEWRWRRELNLLGLDPDIACRPFSVLSGGEQTKIMLAALFLQEDRYLLIDEPTNHLDRAAREAVGAYLRQKSQFLLVSHDRHLLDACADHILAFNRTSIEVHKGNFSSWQTQRQRRDQMEARENERLEGEIRHLTEAARRAGDWSDRVERSKKGSRNAGLRPDRGYIGHQAAKMMKRSKSIENRRQSAAAQKSHLLHDLEVTEPLKLSPEPYFADRLLEAKELQIVYDGRPICQPVAFSLCRGERLCLCGDNGTGKTSLLKLLLGANVPYRGEIQVGSQLKISYVPQDTSFLQGGLRDFAGARGVDFARFGAILRKLDFTREQFEKPLESYSAGQKKKVLLAASLCEKAHLYVWDEPLNYIDLFSRLQIEQLLIESKPAMLFVEHDAAFADRIATGSVTLRR